MVCAPAMESPGSAQQEGVRDDDEAEIGSRHSPETANIRCFQGLGRLCRAPGPGRPGTTCRGHGTAPAGEPRRAPSSGANVLIDDGFSRPGRRVRRLYPGRACAFASGFT